MRQVSILINFSYHHK